MQSLKEFLPQKKQEFVEGKLKKPKYISQEFQHYGFRLASQLNDVDNLSMYIRLAKITPREVLESALSFTIDYPQAKSKSRIFLWKVKQLKDEYKIKSLKVDKKDILKKYRIDDSLSFFSKNKIKNLTIKKKSQKKKRILVKSDSKAAQELKQTTLF